MAIEVIAMYLLNKDCMVWSPGFWLLFELYAMPSILHFNHYQHFG